MGLARLALAAACLVAVPAIALAQSAAAPNTTITFGPATGSYNTMPSPHFEFGSDDPAAGFECSLDGGAFSACTSPHTVGPLSVGPHKFQVRARNATGLDPTPAEREWRHVPDALPPRVKFNGGSSMSIRRLRSFSGTARSSSRVVKVDVALRVFGRRKEDENLSLICQWLDLRTGKRKSTFCLKPPYVRAQGTSRWRVPLSKQFLRRVRPGRYLVQVRAVNEVVAGDVVQHRIELRR